MKRQWVVIAEIVLIFLAGTAFGQATQPSAETKVRELKESIEALERKIERLEAENARLRDQLAATLAQQTSRSRGKAAPQPAHHATAQVEPSPPTSQPSPRASRWSGVAPQNMTAAQFKLLGAEDFGRPVKIEGMQFERAERGKGIYGKTIRMSAVASDGTKLELQAEADRFESQIGNLTRGTKMNVVGIATPCYEDDGSNTPVRTTSLSGAYARAQAAAADEDYHLGVKVESIEILSAP